MADNKSYYSDDAIKAKLSSLNDAQDVIVNVAQWLLFNRRNAARTADLWTQKLKDSQPQKRLSLIYLANGELQSMLPGNHGVLIDQRNRAAVQG